MLETCLANDNYEITKNYIFIEMVTFGTMLNAFSGVYRMVASNIL